MTIARRLRARLRRDQRGMTLIEVLIAMPLALLLLFAAVDAMDVTAKHQSRTTKRTQAITQAKVGIDRMVREVREADSLNLLSSQIVEIVTPVRPTSGPSSYAGNLRLVRYDCSGGKCTRYEGPKSGPVATTGKVLVTDVANADVFTPSPDIVNPTFLGLKLRVSVKGQSNPINVTDGVNLRNKAVG
jgi:prepilin-type N-terminal cleavage/methylation domain-containing protein